MMKHDFQENEAIRYFLGELSETEQAAVEERFFEDEEFSLFFDEVETDLIDSYVRDELDFAQKRKFVEKFLVSERRRERVKAAAILLEKENSIAPILIAETAKPSFWESLKGFFSVPNLAYASFGILLLSLIGGLIWFLQRPSEIVKIGNENINITPTIQPSPTVSPTSTPIANISQNANSTSSEPKKSPTPIEKKEEPKTKPQPQPQPQPQPRDVSPVLAQFGLTSNSLRNGGNEPNKINLKPGTQNVYLRLKFKTEEEFVKYRIELRDTRGNLISSQNLKNKNVLGIKISAQKLRKGNYKITLKGAKSDQDFEDLDFFDLIVEKK
ncbi:MAG TPA: hypothetical protein PKE69_11515 [Pyrinomonadaceae bacterium]|nr:hypothetical protein [Pyrinomonadaceae bacterium]